MKKGEERREGRGRGFPSVISSSDQGLTTPWLRAGYRQHTGCGAIPLERHVLSTAFLTPGSF